MRVLALGLACVLIAGADVSAQSLDGAAGGVVGGAVGRGGVTTSGQLQGRGTVTVPSRPTTGQGRAVGANFDARSGIQAGAHLGGSRAAATRAQLDARGEVGASRQQQQHRQPGRNDELDLSVHMDRGVLHADLQLAHRLAEIDRLRDHALTHDDVNLLMRADILEQQARVQHQQHVARMQSSPGPNRGAWRYDLNGPYQAQTHADVQTQGAVDGHARTQADVYGVRRAGVNYDIDATRPWGQGEVRGRVDGDIQANSPYYAPAVPARPRPTVQADGEAQAQGTATVRPAPRR